VIIFPRFDQDMVAHGGRLKVDHATSTDGRWRGSQKIHRFKNQTHTFVHGYDLS